MSSLAEAHAPAIARALTVEGVLSAAFLTGLADDGAQAIEKREVTAILQNGEPRWIIVGRPHAAMPVLASWQPFKLSSRLKWKAILIAVHLHALPRLPGAFHAQSLLDLSYWRRWVPKLTARWSLAIHVGNPSHTRKAIVFLIDEEAQVRLVAKAPLVEGAGKAILHEAAVLRKLCGRAPVPRPEFTDPRQGVAGQRWLAGAPVGLSFTPSHLELLTSLVDQSEFASMKKMREEIQACCASLNLPLDKMHLSAALALLQTNSPFPITVEHRDFAPWNLKRLPDGRLTLLDWEWALERSLPLQDFCHFFYVQDYLFRGPGDVWPTMQKSRWLRDYLAFCDLPMESATALTAYYLLRTLCQYTANGALPEANYTAKQVRALLAAHRG